jgi:PKHD-type hydroxylase
MLLSLTAISQQSDLDSIQELLADVEWRDGKETAGAVAKAVKDNLQAKMNTPAGQKLRDRLLPFVRDNAVVQAAARPRRISNLLISKTQDNGHYGKHVDNALMVQGNTRLRTDVSFTLFLTPPSEYEGGELVIYSVSGSQTIKGEPGQMILYPSSSIHEVRPVTKGARIVCVGWIESLIPDPTQRELLFDLENLRVGVRAKMPEDAPERLTLDKSIANLLRMWTKP